MGSTEFERVVLATSAKQGHFNARNGSSPTSGANLKAVELQRRLADGGG